MAGLDHLVVQSIASSHEPANFASNIGEVEPGSCLAVRNELLDALRDDISEFVPHCIDISFWSSIYSVVRAEFIKLSCDKITELAPINQSINQIQSLFYTGAGAPSPRPWSCTRRGAPVKRGVLQSTGSNCCTPGISIRSSGL